MPYLDDLRRERYLIAEPDKSPLFTVEDDGTLIMEFVAQHLAIRLTAADADGLAAGVADARRREAEALVDDAALYPHDVADRP
jgi:hypothetical protein